MSQLRTPLLPGGVRYAPWLGLAREPVVCARCKAESLVTKAPILPLTFSPTALNMLPASGRAKSFPSDYHANWVAASIWAFGALFAICWAEYTKRPRRATLMVIVVH